MPSCTARTAPIRWPAGSFRTPASIVSGVPEQGEHTQEILREIGYSDGEIAQLRASRIV